MFVFFVKDLPIVRYGYWKVTGWEVNNSSDGHGRRCLVWLVSYWSRPDPNLNKTPVPLDRKSKISRRSLKSIANKYHRWHSESKLKKKEKTLPLII